VVGSAATSSIATNRAARASLAAASVPPVTRAK
jgi:hypothetical protein